MSEPPASTGPQFLPQSMRECPSCGSLIPQMASRCAHCGGSIVLVVDDLDRLLVEIRETGRIVRKARTGGALFSAAGAALFGASLASHVADIAKGRQPDWSFVLAMLALIALCLVLFILARPDGGDA